MSVDISKIKVGDEVTVRCVVTNLGAAGCVIKMGTAGDVAYAPEANIVSHTPRALQVGDRVRNRKCAAFPANYEGGEILAIADEWAMVRFVSSPGIALLTDLERLP